MAKRKRLTLTPPEDRVADPAAPPAPRAPLIAAPVAQVAGDAAGSAALQDMSDFIADARAEGRLIVMLPLGQIETDHMERDRLLGVDPAADEDMQALLASLRDRGQQVPIDVLRLSGDPRERYGLISGLRRVTALRLLHQETGDEAHAQVKARILKPGSVTDAYRSMIEENEIRVGLSFYERARIALKAVEVGAFGDIRDALRGLYGNVSRAKRSKIGSFVPVVEALDGKLRYPAALSEKRGLALAAALKADEGLARRLTSALAKADAGTADAEQAVVTDTLRAGTQPRPAQPGRAADESIALRRSGERIVLSGPGVDATLERDLAAWLARR